MLRRQTLIQLTAHGDSDWEGCPTTGGSLYGYRIMLGRSQISQKTKKQAIVSTSSTKAEHRVMAIVTTEPLRVRSILRSLGAFHAQLIQLFGDSKAVLYTDENLILHE